MMRELRLRRNEDFGEVYRNGRSWADRLLILRALPNRLDHNRYGFSISKRVGKAVIRNRVKRRLREITRASAVCDGWDIVFIARQPASEADYATLRASVQSLLRRGRLLQKAPPEGTPASGPRNPDTEETRG